MGVAVELLLIAAVVAGGIWYVKTRQTPATGAASGSGVITKQPAGTDPVAVVDKVASDKATANVEAERLRDKYETAQADLVRANAAMANLQRLLDEARRQNNPDAITALNAQLVTAQQAARDAVNAANTARDAALAAQHTAESRSNALAAQIASLRPVHDRLVTELQGLNTRKTNEISARDAAVALRLREVGAYPYYADVVGFHVLPDGIATEPYTSTHTPPYILASSAQGQAWADAQRVGVDAATYWHGADAPIVVTDSQMGAMRRVQAYTDTINAKIASIADLDTEIGNKTAELASINTVLAAGGGNVTLGPDGNLFTKALGGGGGSKPVTPHGTGRTFRARR